VKKPDIGDNPCRSAGRWCAVAPGDVPAVPPVTTARGRSYPLIASAVGVEKGHPHEGPDLVRVPPRDQHPQRIQSEPLLFAEQARAPEFNQFVILRADASRGRRTAGYSTVGVVGEQAVGAAAAAGAGFGAGPGFLVQELVATGGGRPRVFQGSGVAVAGPAAGAAGQEFPAAAMDHGGMSDDRYSRHWCCPPAEQQRVTGVQHDTGRPRPRANAHSGRR